MVLWGVSVAHAECEDASALVNEALQEVLMANPEGARAALKDAEDSLGCGELLDPADSARFFLVEGALQHLLGRSEEAGEALLAARGADERIWIDSLGGPLRQVYDDQQPMEGAAPLSVVADEEHFAVWLDGQQLPSEATVPVGLHLLQVSLDGEAVFGRLIMVRQNTPLTLSPDLPSPEPEPEPVPAVVSQAPVADAGPALTLAVGFQAQLGEALSATSAEGVLLEEPSFKPGVPLELGVWLPLGSAWVEPRLGANTLLAGHYLFATEDGAGAWKVGLTGALHLGTTLGSTELGVGGGLLFPGRLQGSVRGRMPVAGPLWLELEPGVYVGTGGRLEPLLKVQAALRLQ